MLCMLNNYIILCICILTLEMVWLQQQGTAHGVNHITTNMIINCEEKHAKHWKNI